MGTGLGPGDGVQVSPPSVASKTYCWRVGAAIVESSVCAVASPAPIGVDRQRSVADPHGAASDAWSGKWSDPAASVTAVPGVTVTPR